MNIFSGIIIQRFRYISSSGWNPRHTILQAFASSQAAETQPIQKGKISKRIPIFVNLEAEKTYFWCACGYSKKQPYCDGTHSKVEGNTVKPIKFTVPKTKRYLLCRCKQTNNRPYCDLTHMKTFIPEGIRKSLNIKL